MAYLSKKQNFNKIQHIKSVYASYVPTKKGTKCIQILLSKASKDMH